MTGEVLAGVLVVASLLLHELAHGAVAHAFGVPVREFLIGMPPVWRRIGRVRGVDIVLGALPIGAAVGLDDEGYYRLGRVRGALVFLAGPAVNLALALAFAPFSAAAAYWSLLLGLTNLFPLLPLDGGQALAAALGWSQTRRREAASVGTVALVVFCVVLLAGAGAVSLLAGGHR